MIFYVVSKSRRTEGGRSGRGRPFERDEIGSQDIRALRSSLSPRPTRPLQKNKKNASFSSSLKTTDMTLHGLWCRPFSALLDFVAENGFNALRIPVSGELVEGLDTIRPTNIDFSQNPELKGTTAGQQLDHCIREAGKRGMLVLLDLHHQAAARGITVRKCFFFPLYLSLSFIFVDRKKETKKERKKLTLQLWQRLKQYKQTKQK